MFKRFFKIRNHYDRKRVLGWLEYYPELSTCKFIVSEKLHGANAGIQFRNDGTYSFQKRNSDLSLDSNFFNFQSLLKDSEIVSFIEKMSTYCKLENCNWIFFGELYGDGVQKEVKYCSERKLKFFDLYDCDNEQWLTPEETLSFTGTDLYVPIIGYFDGLVSALEVDTEFNTMLNPIEDNICEGVVIRPFAKNYIYMHDHLVVKKKNDKFKEKVKRQINKEKNPLTGKLLEYSDIACSYVSANRLDNVVSHMGEPEGMEDFGKYIAEFLTDIKTDLFDENSDIKELSKSDRKLVLSAANRLAVAMLKGKIMGHNG
jgi:Rnl2 family RNA ligase